MFPEIRHDVVREDASFLYGKTFSRSGPGEEFRFVVDWMRAKRLPWFVGEPGQIFERLGISIETRRANDLENLFDGALSGYYYMEAASDGTDEAAKWMLGAVAAHLNETGKSFSSVHRILPADHLRAFVLYLKENRFERSFAKDVFADLLAAPKSTDDAETGETRRLSGAEVMDIIVADPKFKAVGGSEIDAIIYAVVAANPEQAAKIAGQPKLVMWFVGQTMKAAKGKASAADIQVRLKSRFGVE